MNGNWSDAQLKAALSAVERGSPVQTAALDFDIPRTTLRNHVMGLSLTRKRGRKPVLSRTEEEKVVQYIMGMARYGHPINITELKIKVAEATQLRETPFKDGIPRAGWVRWFRKRHPEISLRMSQGLDSGRARGLCPENVSSFYENLEVMLARGYEASHIWNCDESGAQAGRNGGGRVLAKTGARSVHSIIPKEREWLSVLVCVNAASFHIPNFYIFRGKSFQRDYIKQCEDNASMAMQEKAWMTGHLFKSWIGHFVKNIRDCGLQISPLCRHLLILDGHGSHVTMDVVKIACSIGLDLLTLPSHTFHAMQPLDVACFKQSFRELRDVWTLRHKCRGANKEVLAKWVSAALLKALSEKNIKSGFRATGIFPFNSHAMDDKMGPSEFYRQVPQPPVASLAEPEAVDLGEPEDMHGIGGTWANDSEGGGVAAGQAGLWSDSDGGQGPHCEPDGEAAVASESESKVEAEYLDALEEALGEAEEEARAATVHYYVPPETTEGVQAGWGGEDSWAEVVGYTENGQADDSIDRFLVLPQQDVPTHEPLPAGGEPQIDFSKSYILTSEEYMASLEAKASKKQALHEESRLRKLAAKESKEARRLEKLEKAAKSKARAEERAANKRYNDYWDRVKRDGW
jgi:hypothetical protein